MANVLVISEKPSTARKLADALGNPVKKQGYLEVKRGKDVVQIASAVGHVYTLVEKQKSQNYPVFDIEWVPSPQASENFKYVDKYLNVLKKLAKTADEVIIACDYDIEGELIGYNIWRFLAKNLPVKRMKFSTLTTDELIDSFENLIEVPVQIAKAGETRHFLDWFFGINFSRALMKAIQAGGRFKIMSIGRVQGPSLAILSQREKEIESFKPVPYWQVFADVDKVIFTHEQGKFTEKKKAEVVVSSSPKQGVIAQVTKTITKIQPPNPYDLTTLQMDAYHAFGFTPSATLKLAQYLYENALISYPRTSSQELPEKLNLKKVVSSLLKQETFKEAASKILKTKLKPNNGKKTDPAHPAIHPTGNAPGKLTEQHAKLYDLIVRTFLACFAQPAQRENVNIIAEFGINKFKASGSRTILQGWLEFSPYHNVKDSMIEFEQGQKVTGKIYMEEKETQPPKRYSPASIVKKLEDLGLGTKATRSEVIETLYSRDYITDKKSIRVTPFGLSVYTALSEHCPRLLSENLTKVFEEEMEQIAENKLEPGKVIAEAEEKVTELCNEFKQHELEIGKHLLTALNTSMKQAAELGACKCGGKLLMRRSKFGQFVGCSEYPKCRNIYPLPGKATIITTDKICEKCNTPIIGVKRKEKKFFSMCLDTKCVTKANWGKKGDKRENNS